MGGKVNLNKFLCVALVRWKIFVFLKKSLDELARGVIISDVKFVKNLLNLFNLKIIYFIKTKLLNLKK